MTTITTDRARLEELLGEYWEIAFEESSGVVATGNKANRVLHEIRALFYALAAPATAPDVLERKPSAKEVAWDRVRRSLVVRNAQITIGEVADTMDWQLNDAMKGTP